MLQQNQYIRINVDNDIPIYFKNSCIGCYVCKQFNLGKRISLVFRDEMIAMPGILTK